MHEVVVCGDLTIKELLTKFLGDLGLRLPQFESGCLGDAIFVFPGCSGYDSKSVLSREALVAYICIPSYGIPHFDGVFGAAHHVAYGHIIHFSVCPVVRDLQDKFTPERMMCKRSNGHIVLRFDAQIIAVRSRCKQYIAVGKLGRHLPKLIVQGLFDAGQPLRWHLAFFALFYKFIAKIFKRFFQFGVVQRCFGVFAAGVLAFGHNSILSHCVDGIVCKATFAKLRMPLTPDIIFTLLAVDIPNHKHL